MSGKVSSMDTNLIRSGNLYVCSQCGCEFFLPSPPERTGPPSTIPPYLYCPHCSKEAGIRVDSTEERELIHTHLQTKTAYLALLDQRTRELREGPLVSSSTTGVA